MKKYEKWMNNAKGMMSLLEINKLAFNGRCF